MSLIIILLLLLLLVLYIDLTSNDIHWYHNEIFNKDNRVRYYTKNIHNKDFDIEFNDSTMDFNNVHNKPILYDEDILEMDNINFYLEEFKELYRLGPSGAKYIFVGGDVSNTNKKIPWIAKTRPIEKEGLTTIVPLNRPRHYDPIAKVKQNDIPFEQKKDQLVWRGLNTGKHKREPIEKWITEDNRYGNIGFTRMDQANYTGIYDRKFIKDKMEMNEMLQYKYLLSVEGNDVASNLKWIMASNSVCLMPLPETESWAMEKLMIPWVHYIPLKRDLTDLEQKVFWAKQNPKKVRNIIKNANDYICRLNNKEEDKELVKGILDIYVKRVSINRNE